MRLILYFVLHFNLRLNFLVLLLNLFLFLHFNIILEVLFFFHLLSFLFEDLLAEFFFQLFLLLLLLLQLVLLFSFVLDAVVLDDIIPGFLSEVELQIPIFRRLSQISRASIALQPGSRVEHVGGVVLEHIGPEGAHGG